MNESLLAFEHVDVFPWHLSVEIDYTEFADNEMPAPAESELLARMCDEIEAAILSSRTELGVTNALFLASSTWHGIRELAFQVHDPEPTHTALQALLESREWERPWDYEMKRDPKWQDAAFFFQLFPLANGLDS